ncbi:hypothetical protein ACFX13_018300 [Malus domestica]|uniref:uncharacterized protein LOC126604951 n=1 Tax=Malus sylvestris TaxID=3752 RepID=UPI0021ACBDDF|nr:uncharacterized protein LOC126604951 [Malus sylvestris]
MEDFRSRSCGHGRSQLESYNVGSGSAGPASSGVNGMQDLRCYSASYATSVSPQQQQTQAGNNGEKIRKGKSANGSATKSWSLSDPELQRKKRVASYKVYTVEGKLKGSFRKSFRWLKETCNRVVYGR